MRASLHDLALVQDHNAIGTQDRRQSVGDHQRGAPATGGMHCPLEILLVLGVQIRSRLIHDEHGAVMEQRAGDGQPLALAAGHLSAAFTNLRRVPPEAAP